MESRLGILSIKVWTPDHGESFNVVVGVELMVGWETENREGSDSDHK